MFWLVLLGLLFLSIRLALPWPLLCDLCALCAGSDSYQHHTNHTRSLYQSLELSPWYIGTIQVKWGMRVLTSICLGLVLIFVLNLLVDCFWLLCWYRIGTSQTLPWGCCLCGCISIRSCVDLSLVSVSGTTWVPTEGYSVCSVELSLFSSGSCGTNIPSFMIPLYFTPVCTVKTK
jgi:hypothetical protein